MRKPAPDCFGASATAAPATRTRRRFSIPYHAMVDGLKKIAAGFPDDEQDAMFYRAAERVYSL